MTRGMHHLEGKLSDRKELAIANRAHPSLRGFGEPVRVPCVHVKRNARKSLKQLGHAGDVIEVRMREDQGTQSEAMLREKRQRLGDVTLRIDPSRLPRGPIQDEVDE